MCAYTVSFYIVVVLTRTIAKRNLHFALVASLVLKIWQHLSRYIASAGTLKWIFFFYFLFYFVLLKTALVNQTQFPCC